VVTEPVAIVGMAVPLPGAADLGAYWRNLVAGVDAIGDAPPDRWDGGLHVEDAAAAGPDRFSCRRGGRYVVAWTAGLSDEGNRKES
jgi:acyl transferase domain-containing protein